MARQKRPLRTKDELRAAAASLFYEVHMLYAVAAIADDAAARGNPYWSATIESLLVHTRILLDFFDPTPKVIGDADNIVAGDFFDGEWSPPAWREPIEPLRRRLNKQLAHLSYSRVDGVPWTPHELALLFREPLGRFVSNVDVELLADDWHSIRSHLSR